MEKTFSTATWQNETLGAFYGVAGGDRGRSVDLGLCPGLSGYSEEIVHDGRTHPKTAFRYLENHDRSRFLCRFGTLDLLGGVVREAHRSQWYRLQPYLIGLLLAKGVPLLWQGQGIGKGYDIPSSGYALVALNFTGQDQATTFCFPGSGHNPGKLPGNPDLPVARAGQPVEFTVPSHYCGVRISD